MLSSTYVLFFLVLSFDHSTLGKKITPTHFLLVFQNGKVVCRQKGAETCKSTPPRDFSLHGYWPEPAKKLICSDDKYEDSSIKAPLEVKARGCWFDVFHYNSHGSHTFDKNFWIHEWNHHDGKFDSRVSGKEAAVNIAISLLNLVMEIEMRSSELLNIVMADAENAQWLHQMN